MKGKSQRKRANTASSPLMLVDPSTTFVTSQKSMKLTAKKKRLKEILHRAAGPILEEGLTSPHHQIIQNSPHQYVPNGKIRQQFLPGLSGSPYSSPMFPSVITNQVTTPMDRNTGDPIYPSGNFINRAVQSPLGTYGRDIEKRLMGHSFANSNPPCPAQRRNNVAVSLAQLQQGFAQQKNNISSALGHLQQVAQPRNGAALKAHPLQDVSQHETNFTTSLDRSQDYSTIQVSVEELTRKKQELYDPGSLCIFCRLPVWRSNFEIRHCGHYFHCSCYLQFDHSLYLNCYSCLTATPVFVVNIDRLVGFRRKFHQGED